MKLTLVALTFALLLGADATQVDFDTLSGFEYEEGQELPKKVKKLDGKTIKIRGFMRSLEDGIADNISVFYLVTQTCDCEGMPMMNEVILCTLPDGKTIDIVDEPVTLEGEFEVGEESDGEYVTSIYRLAVTKLD